MENPSKTSLQAKVFDFAVTELVRQNRDSFHPLWTIDSWAKFLIWTSLNCGLSAERDSLELFGDALGPALTRRMRALFFERVLEDLELKILADPAETHALLMPLIASQGITHEKVLKALDRVGLFDRVEPDQKDWQELDALIAIPWKISDSSF